MSHTLTPVSENDIAGVVVPDPGDARTAASVVTPIQSLLNSAFYLFGHVPTLAGASQEVPLTGAVIDDIVATDGWVRSGQLWVQNNVSVASVLWIDLPAPRGYVLNQIHARVKGNGAGGSAHVSLPATLPKITVYETDPTNNNAVLQSATATDPSASEAAYDAAHVINITGLTWTIASDFRKYTVKIEGETGANAAALKLTIASINMSYSPV